MTRARKDMVSPLIAGPQLPSSTVSISYAVLAEDVVDDGSCWRCDENVATRTRGQIMSLGAPRHCGEVRN